MRAVSRHLPGYSRPAHAIAFRSKNASVVGGIPQAWCPQDPAGRQDPLYNFLMSFENFTKPCVFKMRFFKLLYYVERKAGMVCGPYSLQKCLGLLQYVLPQGELKYSGRQYMF